ncbi:MAG: hypothetical protein JRI71_06705 [Deltaproteobacteria bacterium]|nr:hypothetical protein [Deltaproteobacteria bacterium]MBW2077223.1 hypothetical protein [Deltaproteobacteria bacterium]
MAYQIALDIHQITKTFPKESIVQEKLVKQKYG